MRFGGFTWNHYKENLRCKSCWFKVKFNQHLAWVFQILYRKQLSEAARRFNKARYDSGRRSFLEEIFHAENAACMNELWKVVFSRHGIPGTVGNYWGGEIDRWTLYRNEAMAFIFTGFVGLPESSGSRFTLLGWANSACASEVCVPRPTVGRHLQTENWSPINDVDGGKIESYSLLSIYYMPTLLWVLCSLAH